MFCFNNVHVKSCTARLQSWLSSFKVYLSCCESTLFHHSDINVDFRPWQNGRHNWQIGDECSVWWQLKCLRKSKKKTTKMLFAIWVTCPFDPGMITCDHSLDKLLSCCVLLSPHQAATAAAPVTQRTGCCGVKQIWLYQVISSFKTNNEWLLWANQTGLLWVHKFHWELMFPDAAVTASLVGIQISKTLTFQYICILEQHLRSSIGLWLWSSV